MVPEKTLHLSHRVVFQINAEALSPLEDFPYLGQTIAYNNGSRPAVYHNLKKFWGRWGMITRMLENTGAMVRECGVSVGATVWH